MKNEKVYYNLKKIEVGIKKLWNQEITKYLIKWKNLPLEDLTWENEFFIQKHP